MPTGYTADVQSGKIKDLATFTMQCARAFGALIEMRDDPMDAPVREFTVGDYHPNAIREAEARIEHLHGMTMAERYAEWRNARDERVAYIIEWRQKRDLTEGRYRSMLAKVRAWKPPTPDHDGLKGFMVEQLTSSIDFDCGGDYTPANKVPATVEEWWVEEVRQAEKSLVYHSKELEEERQRVRERNEWVRQLRDSLAITEES